ncbi:DUF397 domain-containing protein [Streptomyces sp. RFCAC02]|uniref:DUF397 domain-containing protein n=1 Tax=Streptomyces sp. RFCAC02 TaxID=2499143 RepID=UPI00101F7CEE|nr:DUF397 domain-containing protein [Streptomyces sp. RFCAC02]
MTSEPRWSKSSYSNGDACCVEVALGTDAVGTRDSKHRSRGPELWVSPDTWRAFVHATVANGFTR